MHTAPGASAERARHACRTLLTVVLVAGLLGTGLFAAGGAGAVAAGTDAPSSTAAADGPTTTDSSAFAQEVDADRTRIRIELEPDGDGQWTVELWTRLEDDADEEAFADLQADVETNASTYTADFRDRMAGSVDSASDATGREMAMENVTVSTRTEGVPSSYGVLAYEFTWTNFAAVDGDRLRAGAAIDAFLLEDGTRLAIAWPSEYRATSIEPASDDRTDTAAVWQGGESDFLTGEPRVVVTNAPAQDDSILPLVGLVVAVIAILFVLAWLVHSGRLRAPPVLGGEPAEEQAAGDGRQPDATANSQHVASADNGEAAAASGAADSAATDTADDGAPADATADEAAADGTTADDTSPDDSTADDGPTDQGTAEDAAASAAASTAGADDSEGDELPPELLSNEEQVLRLLEAEGGRLKQQQVVAELEWTDAKTSQVVTSMREEGQIEVFRIGRENVLALPGEMDI